MATSVRDQARTRLTATRHELSQANARKQKATNERENLEEQLARLVKSKVHLIADGQWGMSLIGAATKVHQAEIEIMQAQQTRDRKSGFWATIGGYIEYGFDGVVSLSSCPVFIARDLSGFGFCSLLIFLVNQPPPALWECGNPAPLLLAGFPSAVERVGKSAF
jgi:hypothetical protein